jgi:CubicO group peptidase (beta-lactamase class C family)
VLACLLLVAAPALARGRDAGPAGAKSRSPISELLEPIRRKHGVPALGGAVLTSRHFVAAGVTGVRRLGADHDATLDDRWHLGSCTKSMTATLVARLVEQGRLAWDLTLAEALPDLAERMHADWKGVTLELLLANRGGAPTSLDAGGLWTKLWKHEGPAPDARRLLAEGVLTRPPAVKPGTAYVYSNAGFSLAGHVAETMLKTPYEDLMRTHVFEPLGMTHAGFGAPGDAPLMDEPQGHHVADGRLVPVPPGPGADNPVAIAPAGRVHCTLADWARYVQVHLGASATDGQEPFLHRTTLTRLHTPPDGQDYALGWIATRRGWGGGRVLTHSGSNTMWYATAWLAPLRDFAVLTVCNRGGAEGGTACDEAAGRLIRWYGERIAREQK